MFNKGSSLGRISTTSDQKQTIPYQHEHLMITLVVLGWANLTQIASTKIIHAAVENHRCLRVGWR